jgi:hypothetical protein
MKIAYIEWEDAKEIDGRLSLGAAGKERPFIMKTAGVLIREDEEAVTIAQDWYEWTDGEGEEHTTVREVEVIPRGMVRRLEIKEIVSCGEASAEHQVLYTNTSMPIQRTYAD